MARTQVLVTAQLHDIEVDDAFARLKDFSVVTDFVDIVKSIEITRDKSDVQTSKWAVRFRTGIMQWSQRDTFDERNRTISFEQIEGDAEHFSGEWSADNVSGVSVHFKAEFDLGIPSLADMLDPLAEREIRSNTTAILRGLYGDSIDKIV